MNCGSCGHYCRGAQDSAGHIVPAQCIVGGCEAYVLVDATDHPAHLRWEGPYISWSTDTAIERLPVSGGTPTILQSGVSALQAFVYTRPMLYWIEGGSTLARAQDNGQSPSRVTLPQPATGLADFPGYALFYTTADAIMQIDYTSSSPQTLVSGQTNPSHLIYKYVFDYDFGEITVNAIFWIDGADGGSIKKMDLSGGVPGSISTLATQTHAVDLAVGDTAVFFLTNEQPPSVKRLNQDGTDLQTLYTGAANEVLSSLAQDGEGLAWVGAFDRLMAMGTDGSNVRVLTGPQTMPRDLSLNYGMSTVFWINAGTNNGGVVDLNHGSILSVAW
jgi:hypothetical protein